MGINETYKAPDRGGNSWELFHFSRDLLILTLERERLARKVAAGADAGWSTRHGQELLLEAVDEKIRILTMLREDARKESAGKEAAAKVLAHVRRLRELVNSHGTAIQPQSLSSDQQHMLSRILNHPRGVSAPSKELLLRCGIGRPNATDALRDLERMGLYEGFVRAPRKRLLKRRK